MIYLPLIIIRGKHFYIFYFYRVLISCFISRKHEKVQTKIGQAEALKDTDFDPKRTSVFIIHGWRNDYDSSINTEIRQGILIILVYLFKL